MTLVRAGITLSGATVPIEYVAAVVLGLVAALGWMARRYDRANERALRMRGGRREAAILLREALREQDPHLEPISFDDDSAVLEVEYDKDRARVRNRSMRPPPDDRKLSPEQERRVKRFALTGDPSTPPEGVDTIDDVPRPRKKVPSRND